MEARDVLFGLHELQDIGWKTIRVLYEHFSDLQEIMSASSEYIHKLGIHKHRAERIAAQLNRDFIERRMEMYQKDHIHFMTYADEQFPVVLKESPYYPWVLYYRGDPSLTAHFTLAMVGTRVPTNYGRIVADRIASELAQSGICIVSGMARGIDSIAHRAALRADGKTIAVLGTSLEHIYPQENRKLFAELVERGLVVSEYPLGTVSHAKLFPQRNRIIACLSYGTIFVEGKVTSGACHTARYSLDAARDVFSIPGPITSPNSEGPMRFVTENQAKLVLGTQDILNEYKYLRIVSQHQSASLPFTTKYWNTHSSPSLSNIQTMTNSTKNETSARHNDVHPLNRSSDGQGASSVSEEERIVLNEISLEPISIDELLTVCKLDFGHLHSILLSLTMKKQIVQLPGSKYIRSIV